MIRNPDKFGYYKVNEKKFYSKIEASIYATQLNLPRDAMSWHYNEQSYDTMNWQIEPEESLDMIYEQRAAEIRARYDYVIISYSGGSDSHNVLMSFIRAGLHVDELIVHTFEKSAGGYENLSKSDTSSINSQHTDYVFHTLPMLKEISKIIPKTKITVVDQSDDLERHYTDAKDESWVLTRTENLGLGNNVKYNYVKEIRKHVDKTKSIGIVIGADKPRVGIGQGDYLYFVLADKGINASRSAIDSMTEFDNVDLELFYWGSTAICCRMLAKQSHVIANWLTINPQFQPFFLKKNNTKTMYRVVHERVLRNVIYSIWNNSWFQADKSVAPGWYNDLDVWYLNNRKLSENTAIWKEGLSFVMKNASTFVEPNQYGVIDGLMIFTKTKKIAKVTVDETHRLTDDSSWTNDEMMLRIKMNKVFYNV